MASTKRSQAGFSAVELLVAVAIIAVMVGLAAPGISAYHTQQATRQSARDVASLLGNARSRALEDGVPYLVYFNDESAVARAVVVRDSDASYSITPGDTAEPVRLALQRDPDVYTVGEIVEPLWMNSVPMLNSEPSSTQVASGGSPGGPGPSSGPGGGSPGGPGPNSGPGGGSPGGPGPSSGPGGGTSITATSTPTLGSGLQAGTSFPIDTTSSRPAIAFNSRGLPVSTDSPNAVGSGTGVLYLTNSRGALFGVIVNPLGTVGVRQWNRQAQTWN